MNNKYVTVEDAACYLGVPEGYIRRLVAERRVDFHKIGKHVRFTLDALDAVAVRVSSAR